ncbi:MAG TPA: thiolase family protein [Nocardioidaceae bacterium]|nr:thiolase family protein [Nocardioidaceae bacterium]
MSANPRSEAPVVVAALRAPIGTAGGALARVPAADLAAPVLSAVGGELPDEPLRDVVLGNCMGPGGNVARVAALTAGLPVDVPALTVDRQCGSGLAAVEVGVALLRGSSGVVLAGGVESVSTAPLRFWPGDPPVRYDRAPFAPAGIGDPDMGYAADLLAEKAGVSRARQDAYAARSHALAVATRNAGGFDTEVVPVHGVSRDERPRVGLGLERLGRLRPAFRAAAEGGTVTAGNACGVNDGAAVVALVDAQTHRRLDVPGLRVLAAATAGVDPNLPGLGVVPATEQALAAAGLSLADLDVIEVNEAFAGQVLACCDALSLDPERVCVEGGALALGHPWGASGAVLLVRLFSQLVRADGGRYGLAAIAVGGGQGVAMVVERCR